MRSMWHHQKLPSKGFGAQYKGSPLTFRSSLDSCQHPYSSRSQHRSTARILRFLSLILSVVALEYIGHRHISSECLQKLPAIMFGLPSSGNSWCYELHPFNIKRLSMPWDLSASTCLKVSAEELLNSFLTKFTFLSHSVPQVKVLCPSTSHEVHLQCYFSDRIASIEDVRCELQALGVEPSYMRATQIEGDARTVISAVHVVIDSEETAHMWDNYGKSNTPLILQYLGKEVTLSVPVNHQTACLETPFEHWQRFGNEYEAPITRLFSAASWQIW